MNLCTFLLPSRGRIEQLFSAIQSINDSSTGDDYSIVVRIDRDDSQTINEKYRLEELPHVKVVVGEKLTAALDVEAYQDAAELMTGTWMTSFNDDMILAGDWYGQLSLVPTRGCFAQPEIHQLNASVYLKDDQSCLPFFINRCWEEAGLKIFPSPIDACMVALLKSRSWKAWFLPGVAICHNRNKP